ncbi:electron transfer flavoprotein subunit beta/FixA family protein [Desulfovermiculus halophilus]|uniref:electron transfer flavoprotein subunit beta/FixA family protein n=1 Tax=Desulfovermiculus halophilus TaxID=339722 RepID=UPI000481F866|nr:electron transfer flavoprotein subunit beta/FixA family protein [Desulfovermiculus halophilus]
MTLRIVVFVKQVPDTQNVTGQAMKEDGTVNRDALPAIFNPEDQNALEEALRIKETVGEATVTAISMGPPKASEVLKECLYRGVDQAVLVSDRGFAGADTLATSYALACAVQRLGRVDLVLCGRQAIDGDTAQVGPQVAQKLNMNQITSVSAVQDVHGEYITVVRSVETGDETVRSRFPVLMTVSSAANDPRPPRAKLVMAYKNILCHADDAYDESYIEPECGLGAEHIKQWNMASIQADPQRCGLSGSATKVKKIESVVLAATETKRIDNTPQAISGLVHELVQEHILG